MKKLILATFATTLLFSNASFAIEKPTKANTCVGCHGADGNSLVPNFPKIAGQHAAYLEKALKDYRDGFRNNATMQSFAKGLTDEDIKELAAYFSAQKQK